MAAIDKSQDVIDGRVWLTLYKGNVYATARESSSSLYDQELSSMDIEGGFNQQDSARVHQGQRPAPDGAQRDHARQAQAMGARPVGPRSAAWQRRQSRETIGHPCASACARSRSSGCAATGCVTDDSSGRSLIESV